MEKQKRKLECLQSVQMNLHGSPSDSELRRKLMDQSVMDAAYGCFMRTTNPFYDPFPLRYPHKLTKYLPEGISHKELGIINLTAQFMAVYGIFFQRALIKTVIMDPRFEFMTKPPDDSNYYELLAGFIPTEDSKFSFYCRLFRGYMAISKPCQELTKNAGASPETVLDGFFDLLAQLEKQEDEGGVEKIGMVDLHVFEFLAKTLDQMMPFPPGHLSNMLEPLKSKIIELLMTPSYDQPDDSHDKMRELVNEMYDVSSRHSWRSSVSYHACYQQMQILSQDYSICEHPKDLQNNSDQGPSLCIDLPSPNFTSLIPAFSEHPPPSPQPKDLQNNSDQGPADPHVSFWNDLPPPKFTSSIPEGITRKELGIIKLTAQFEAVYGWYFRDDIEKRVIVDPRFKFLGYSFFSQLYLGYCRVLIPSRKKPSLETVLEGFWKFVEMVEEGVDMRMIDLHAFEFFANMEDQELKLPPQYIVMMMCPLVPPFAHLQARIPHGQFPLPPPRTEHPNPKRLKVDKYSTRPGFV
ncbi:putative splicing factor 3A subunit 1 [Cardamine amara subsp. amara]|uniref:Splicing factor 3A subunit 1 n=1 Tax=Cardamine amara subsp. amara TaxID=228776 RepID=A0ABD0ZEZ2_CARAN